MCSIKCISVFHDINVKHELLYILEAVHKLKNLGHGRIYSNSMGGMSHKKSLIKSMFLKPLCYVARNSALKITYQLPKEF